MQVQRVAIINFSSKYHRPLCYFHSNKLYHKSHPGNSSVAVNTENPLVPALQVLRAAAVTKLTDIVDMVGVCLFVMKKLKNGCRYPRVLGDTYTWNVRTPIHCTTLWLQTTGARSCISIKYITYITVLSYVLFVVPVFP